MRGTIHDVLVWGILVIIDVAFRPWLIDPAMSRDKERHDTEREREADALRWKLEPRCGESMRQRCGDIPDFSGPKLQQSTEKACRLKLGAAAKLTTGKRSSATTAEEFE